MFQPSESYIDRIFQGHESPQITFRDEVVVLNKWYIGTEKGRIEAGPYDSVDSATWNFWQMTDTRGT